MLNDYLYKIYDNQYYKNLDNKKYDASTVIRDFIHSKYIYSEKSWFSDKVREPLQRIDYQSSNDKQIKNARISMKNMKSEPKDSSIVNIEIPKVPEDISHEQYHIKNSKLLKVIESFNDVIRYYRISKTQCMLLWALFSYKTITTRKCMQLGIAHKKNCAINFEKLIADELVNKYSPGGNSTCVFALTEKGMNFIINVLQDLKKANSF